MDGRDYGPYDQELGDTLRSGVLNREGKNRTMEEREYLGKDGHGNTYWLDPKNHYVYQKLSDGKTWNGYLCSSDRWDTYAKIILVTGTL